jgi:ComF family protein
LALEKDARCSICGRPLISELVTCLPCRNGGKYHFDRIVALFPYAGDYQKMLAAYKFGKRLAIGNFLLEKLVESLGLFPDFMLKAPVLTPVPPRPGKIKQTGWDQIDYLARLLEKAYRRGEQPFPVFRCLKRSSSQAQKKLSKAERLTNLVNKIQCYRPVPPEIMLFDDVITTGATMNACAAALKQSGAKKVYGVCLFYT